MKTSPHTIKTHPIPGRIGSSHLECINLSRFERAPHIPPDRQTPHPWLILHLRGGQTRFYRDDETFTRAADTLRAADAAFASFAYDAEMQQYVTSHHGTVFP